MSDLESQLKIKKICRFCLVQDENVLSNLYSRENRLKSCAPLPLQVMACVSIEVFTNDGMPSTICDHCRMVMEYCYRFKQMCKKADTALRQFPLTGKWPDNLEHPTLKMEQINPIKPIETNSPSTPQSATRPRLKILNKNPCKILNKDAPKFKEPMLKQPILKHTKDGTIELVTEIIDSERCTELDPVSSAEPVETNVFPCPHCERSFPLRQLLDIHVVNHNRDRNFECEHCEKKFFSKYDLGKHVLTHLNERPFKCTVCNKAFTRSTLLHRHEKIHTDIPKFLCVYCEKPFISKEELAKHTERHNKKRPFPCKVCDKSFAFKQGLDRHEVVHAREQPFPCQYCNLSFSTPSKLSRHLTAHAGKRPYPCKLCPKSYLLSHHLSRHLRSHKEGMVNFKCYDCDKTFKTRDSLIYHSAVHATETLICPICKEQFDNIDLVTEHIKMHALGEQFACAFCDLIFMTQTKLDDHCNNDHAEDIAVYNEHDKNNIKIENKNVEAAEVAEAAEVLQEFIIEEFSEDVESTNDYGNIKQEEIEINDNQEEAVASLSTRSKTRSNVVQLQPNTDETYSQNFNSNEEYDFTEEESALFEELIEEQPQPKIARIDETSAMQKVKSKPKSTELPAKTKQSTLTSIVKNLSKEITISRKQKKSDSNLNVQIKKPSETNNTMEIEILSPEKSVKSRKSNDSNATNKEISQKSKTVHPAAKNAPMPIFRKITKAQAEEMAKQGRINYNSKGELVLNKKFKKNTNC